MREGLVEDVMSKAASGTLLNRLNEQTSIMPQLNLEERNSVVGNCYASHPLFREKGIGSICAKEEILLTIAKDFSTTGKCNFYLIEEYVHVTYDAAAFQVGQNCSIIK